MSNVIQFVPPLDLSKVVSELEAITNSETTGIAIITCSPDRISVRTFGEREKLAEAVELAVPRIIDKEAFAH